MANGGSSGGDSSGSTMTTYLEIKTVKYMVAEEYMKM